MENALLEMTQRLEKTFSTHSQLSEIGLHYGLSGITYLKYIFNEPEAFAFQNAVYDKVEDFSIRKTFCVGLAGLGWMLQSLVNLNYLELEEDTFIEIDDILEKWMFEKISDGDYDFMHGATGAALYYLKRINSSKEYATQITSEYTKLLLSKAEQHSSDSIYWKRTLDLKPGYPDRVDLGLSHGLPSILVYLCKVYEKGILQELIYPQIKYLSNYILFLENKDHSKGFFPTAVRLEKNGIIAGTSASRLAWCYGDLGVCISLWHANKILKSSFLADFIMKVLTHSAGRRDLNANGVKDAGICHGSAGIAHIFKRFFHRYQDEYLLDAANYWYDVTLKMSVHEDGIAGFKALASNDGPRWIKDFGMLEGVGGIYASLKYARDESEPIWDEMFLIS